MGLYERRRVRADVVKVPGVVDAPDVVKVPDDVRREARRGLELKAKGYKGARALGIRRGHQLAERRTVSVADLQVMRAWYARHVATSYPNYARWCKASAADRARRDAWRGAVAWLLWGGTPGYRWVLSLANQRRVVDRGTRLGKRLKPHVAARDGVVSCGNG